jgi:transcriptional regulator with XRE-family HTH domain
MPMHLPGTIHEKIGDLRASKGWSQKELSEITGIAASQISRIENGSIENISSDILIKLANAFGVSTDYILGLTTVSTRKSYDIGELGLSEGVVRGLVTGTVDVQMLNRLIEHKAFPYLLHLIKSYFDNSISAGVAERNAVIDMATATLGDFTKDTPKHKKEAKADTELLRSQKLANSEAEMVKISSTFTAILKDIKKDLDGGGTTGQPATAEFLQAMREQIQAARLEQKPVEVDDVVTAMMGMVGQTVELDEKSAELFKQLARGLLTKKDE